MYFSVSICGVVIAVENETIQNMRMARMELQTRPDKHNAPCKCCFINLLHKLLNSDNIVGGPLVIGQSTDANGCRWFRYLRQIDRKTKRNRN